VTGIWPTLMGLPSNVDIRFKEPVRLNLYPFRWFTLIQLAVDRPDKFVGELSREIGDVPRA